MLPLSLLSAPVSGPISPAESCIGTLTGHGDVCLLPGSHPGGLLNANASKGAVAAWPLQKG